MAGRKTDLQELVNRSITQTLSRSVNTFSYTHLDVYKRQGVKCTALSLCGLGGLPAFFGDTFVIWCILMIVSFVGAFLITSALGFEDIPEEAEA